MPPGSSRSLLLHPPAQAPHPDDFADLGVLASQILAFEQHYNTVATPFDRKFTRTNLNQLLTRLARHDPAMRSLWPYDDPDELTGATTSPSNRPYQAPVAEQLPIPIPSDHVTLAYGIETQPFGRSRTRFVPSVRL